ncbi:hypothetical protein CC80DRAFT_587745 [Byssothecium circinans]|uniref:Mid2 domain-containing protein n=1 Tax=Byssothecium circinans TaxID=147558 RepID=A0A6A5UEH5_9PLEO|nr:hypothetical protein CC80DRAFT_587745 [Byssothecium circinans]
MAFAQRCLIFAALFSNAIANFTFPGPMGKNGDYVTGVPDWTVGTKQTLKWKTNLDNYAITLWQQDMSGTFARSGNQIYLKGPSDDEVGQFEWTIDPKGFDLKLSKVFWLNLRHIYKEDNSFKSTYFNLSAATTTTTSAGPSPTSSTTNTPPPMPDKNDNVIKLALGIGLGVGIPIIVLLAAGIWLASKYMKRRYPEDHQDHDYLQAASVAKGSYDKGD